LKSKKSGDDNTKQRVSGLEIQCFCSRRRRRENQKIHFIIKTAKEKKMVKKIRSEKSDKNLGKKKKKKTYLLTFERRGKDFVVFQKQFPAKNDKEAKAIAEIYSHPYLSDSMPQKLSLVEIRTVKHGLLPNNLKEIFNETMKKQGFKRIPVGPDQLKNKK
jgi:hypothetical protein